MLKKKRVADAADWNSKQRSMLLDRNSRREFDEYGAHYAEQMIWRSLRPLHSEFLKSYPLRGARLVGRDGYPVITDTARLAPILAHLRTFRFADLFSLVLKRFVHHHNAIKEIQNLARRNPKSPRLVGKMHRLVLRIKITFTIVEGPLCRASVPFIESALPNLKYSALHGVREIEDFIDESLESLFCLADVGEHLIFVARSLTEAQWLDIQEGERIELGLLEYGDAPQSGPAQAETVSTPEANRPVLDAIGFDILTAMSKQPMRAWRQVDLAAAAGCCEKTVGKMIPDFIKAGVVALKGKRRGVFITPSGIRLICRLNTA